MSQAQTSGAPSGGDKFNGRAARSPFARERVGVGGPAPFQGDRTRPVQQRDIENPNPNRKHMPAQEPRQHTYSGDRHDT